MAEVKWIKIVTDIFDDEKILLIESLPKSDAIIVLWFKLLCLAGKNNSSGVFTINGNIPYTEEMFATIFRRNISVVRLALKTFESFGMIETINGVVTIPKWGKHQNFDRIEQKNEYMKNYMKDYRDKQKLLTSGECESNSKANSKANVSEADLELELEADKIREDKSTAGPSISPHAENLVVMAYGSLCPNLLPFAQMTKEREAAIAGLLKVYSPDQVKDAFRKYNASEFCRGGGAKKWVAGFDFAIKPESVTKALSGFYDGVGSTAKPRQKAKAEAGVKKRYDDLVE